MGLTETTGLFPTSLTLWSPSRWAFACSQISSIKHSPLGVAEERERKGHAQALFQTLASLKPAHISMAKASHMAKPRFKTSGRQTLPLQGTAVSKAGFKVRSSVKAIDTINLTHALL